MDSQKKLADTGTLKLTMPTCSFDLFAISNGVTVDVVRGWADKNHIPTLKLGRKRLVNLAKLTLTIS